jgi:membrane-associated phospholipid phosphatase
VDRPVHDDIGRSVTRLDPDAPSGRVRAWRDIGLALGMALALALLFQLYVPLNHGPPRWIARTPLDELIPLVVPMVVPYVSIYPIGVLTAVAFWLMSARLLHSALLASILTLAASYVCYFVAQTYVERPAVSGDDFLSSLLRSVYAVDQPYNAFPSLHVGVSVVIAVHWLWSGGRTGFWIAAWCGLIACSTVFVHQHYLADVLGGLVVGASACLLSRRIIGGLHDRRLITG